MHIATLRVHMNMQECQHMLQVLDSPTHAGCTLPDNIPGQANVSQPSSFSFFSAPQAAASSAAAPPGLQTTWTNAATSGLQLPHQIPQPVAQQPGSAGSSHSSQSTAQLPAVPSCLAPPPQQQGLPASSGGPARWGLDMRGTEHKSKAVQAAGRAGKGPINEVVCGAMMLAYERAGKWEQVSHAKLLG